MGASNLRRKCDPGSVPAGAKSIRYSVVRIATSTGILTDVTERCAWDYVMS